MTANLALLAPLAVKNPLYFPKTPPNPFLTTTKLWHHRCITLSVARIPDHPENPLARASPLAYHGKTGEA